MERYRIRLLTAVKRLRHLSRYLGGVERETLVPLIFVALGLFCFIKISSEVLEGDTQAFDDRIVLRMRNVTNIALPIGPPWLQEMGRDATALGGLGWLFLATIAVAGYLFMDRRPHLAWFLLISTSSGLIVSLILKGVFSRPRPDLVPHLSNVYTSSFPSGHSMLAAVTYLTLGTLLSSVVKRPQLKAYFLIVAMTITVIVGCSRIYLGVHYPTDVIAGWVAGLSWALICSTIARRLQIIGRIEKSKTMIPSE